MSIESNQLLSKRYRIIRQIGSGGMSSVYLAIDEQTSRDVAIKVLKEELQDDQEFVSRFQTEAKAASSLNHPHVVKVLGVGQDGGKRYMVQEYISGKTLKQVIQERGRIDWEESVHIALQVASGLEHAHAHGVVHRDIKPHNILMTDGNTAMLTDFGIARASTSNTVTIQGGSTMGSVHYFSPEQARGGIVGPKADIYSLGVMIYEMVTGLLPFEGETSVAVAVKHLQETPANPTEIHPDIPDGLSRIIHKCMQKAPSARYESARELYDELGRFLENPEGSGYGLLQSDSMMQTASTKDIEAESPHHYLRVKELESTINERSSSRVRERAVVIGVIVAVLVLLIGGLAFFIQRIRSQLTPGVTDQYIVENFVGQRYDIVRDKLNSHNIRHEMDYIYSDDIQVNHVVGQSIEPGTALSSAGITTLYLEVSQGTNQVLLPDYVERNARAVQDELQDNYDINVLIQRENHPTITKESVIRTEPPYGSTLNRGGNVTLFVSDGPGQETVPQIYGRPLNDVLTQLSALGFTVSEVRVQSERELERSEMYVIASDPEQGAEMSTADPIVLTVSDEETARALLSPEPSNTPSPEPANTPTPEPTHTPSPEPTNTPTPEPTNTPSPEPSNTPSPEPTNTPSPEPTNTPSPEPTNTPTPEPTNTPTPEPTNTPTPEPASTPTPVPVTTSATSETSADTTAGTSETTTETTADSPPETPSSTTADTTSASSSSSASAADGGGSGNTEPSGAGQKHKGGPTVQPEAICTP